MGFEPTHRNRHYPLKVACLPISPSAHYFILHYSLTVSSIGEKNYWSKSVCQLYDKHSFCAQNRTRTCTALRPLVPETSVSTNFTIWADCIVEEKRELDFCFIFFEINKHTIDISEQILVRLLERKTGLEPATPTLARSCSTNWATFAIYVVG